ncbi:MAG: oligoribonuclease [bacterium]|nr:oligoribonuclease [bacterium]
MNSSNKVFPPERWVWIDLEMTGLDENNCVILQAAMVITDGALNEIASTDIVIWQPEAALLDMVPIVKSMHTKNGLLRQVRASSTSLLEAENQLMSMLSEHVAFGKGILAGNSIYMDRRFLHKYMPGIDSYLNYRQIDVSSIKLVCFEWFKQKAPKKPSTHTALEDIRESIAELKYFKDNCFKQKD